MAGRIIRSGVVVAVKRKLLSGMIVKGGKMIKFRSLFSFLGLCTIGPAFYFLGNFSRSYFLYFLGFGVGYASIFMFLNKSYWLSGFFHGCKE